MFCRLKGFFPFNICEIVDFGIFVLIENKLSEDDEPPLVDAYGRPEHDLLQFPDDREKSDRICDELLKTATEVAYGDAPEQKMWIFNPLGVQPDELRPCVFFIHGGGWGGLPRMLAAQAAYLQRRGYSAVSIHFRAPKGKLTPHDSLRDARSAYRWIVQHGREHHIDPDNIVVSGGSAGGHLSLALSTIALPDDPIVEHPPKGFVLLNPVIDLVDGWEGGRKKCLAAGIDPQSFSPAHHIVADLPPTLILSGEQDALIPPSQIRAFQQRMRDAGSQCDFIEYPGVGHGYFNYGRKRNTYFQYTMWAIVESLDGLGRGEPEGGDPQ